MLECSKCDKEKSKNDFYKRSTPYGYDSYCKSCRKIIRRQWAEKNKQNIIQYNKKYNNEHVEEILQNRKEYSKTAKEKLRKKQYNQGHKEEASIYQKQWYLNNKEKKNKQGRDNYQKNKEQINKRRLERQKNNINAKIASNLRGRINKTIIGNYKAGSAVNDLGCPIGFFKCYIEQRFQVGMTWDNYGRYGWHLDHIKPLSLFDLTNKEQFLQACHYTNYQPLWWKQNISKGNNY